MKVRSYLDWRVLILFGVLGPLLGAVVFLAVVASGGSGSVGSLVPIAPLVLAWGYFFGAIPALATGLLAPAGFVLACSRVHPEVLGKVLVGALLGWLTTFVFWRLALGFPSTDSLRMATVGVASGGACALATHWLGVGPNNSFKPKPLRGSA